MPSLVRHTGRLANWMRRRPAVVLAILAYVPMLLTSPGKVSADTKSYLTLDPTRLLSRAVSMWDPLVGAGTIPHQNIGYLFPLGPYYWIMDRIGVPDWVTQRMLWGTLVFLACLGTLRLCQWLGWGLGSSLVAAIAYGFSPYLLSYVARLSVILAPWAAMPWLIVTGVRAVRVGGWKWPARLALVIALVGSSNATSLIFAGLGPVVWVLGDVAQRSCKVRAVAMTAAKAGLCAFVVSFWWIVGLRIQGTYGLPILRFTETYETVAAASSPTEIVRGLGYWFFYGGDGLDRWVGPSVRYITNPAVIALGFLIAGASLAGFFSWFRGRVNASMLLVVGLGLSVGSFPLSSSTPWGSMFKGFTTSTAGMALRSTPRAAPLVILGLAMGLGSACAALGAWLSRRSTSTTVVRLPYLAAVGALILQMFPWFSGGVLTPSLLRSERLPNYVTDLAEWLDGNGSGRVYEIPGADFASYRWGGTVDPVLPGLIDRPYLAKELVPQGGIATADLLGSIERRMSDGWFEPQSLRSLAERMAVGTVVVRNDLEYERYGLARPGVVTADATAGLGDPSFAGPTIVDSPRQPMLDEQSFARPDAPHSFPAVAAFQLNPNEPDVMLRPISNPMVVAGNGDALVDLAASGLLDGQRAVLYVDDPTTVPAGARTATDPWYIVTDTNRRQGLRWSSLGANRGALETAEQQPAADLRDNRLDVVPSDSRLQTVLEVGGDAASVTASGYGNAFSYTPEDAAWFAFDDDTTTAWRTGVFDDSTGSSITLELTKPVTADRIVLTQPQRGFSRTITRIRITLNDRSFEASLGAESTSASGQLIKIPAEPFSSLTVTVLADSTGPLANYAGQPGVGFAEINIPGVDVATAARLPTAILQSIDDLADRRLTVVMTRQRIGAGIANRFDPEPVISRVFDIPAARTFEVAGELRLSADASDSQIQQLVAPGAVVHADANRRMPSAPALGAWAAIDNDPISAWTTPFGEPGINAVGAAIALRGDAALDGKTLAIRTVVDDRHSLVRQVRTVDRAGRQQLVTIGDDGIGVVQLPSGTGNELIVEVVKIDARNTVRSSTKTSIELPVALQVDGLGQQVPDVALPIECRYDLLKVDGVAVGVRLGAVSADLSGAQGFPVTVCDGSPIVLAAGRHTVSTVPGWQSGVDIDRLVFDSPVATQTSNAPATVSSLTLVSRNATNVQYRIAASDVAQWFVLRQSQNAGWTASINGVSLGGSALIDGFANGWIIPKSTAEQVITVTWTPQRSVRRALGISAGSLVALIAIAFWPWRRSRPLVMATHEEPQPVSAIGALPWLIAGLAIVFGGTGGMIGLLVWLVVRRWRFGALVSMTMAGAIAAAWVVVLQVGYRYAPGADWPGHFAAVAPATWAAITISVMTGVSPREQRQPVVEQRLRPTNIDD